MSFDINGPSEKPSVIGAQNMQNNGGGGNLGYMQQGKKEDKDKSIFQNQIQEDEFIPLEEPPQIQEPNFIVKLFNKLMEILGQNKENKGE